MTAWSDIMSAALVQIDDVRLQEQLAVSPAQFYRRMAAMVKQALPLLCRPPELLAYLKRGMVAPMWDDFEWESTEASTEKETVVDTGKTGFALCSVASVQTDGSGRTTLTPYPDAVYDAATGNVTFPAQLSQGISYELDFYSDGEFPDLTETQMRLFALAVACVWDERFSRTWLNMTPKIHDSSFETVNEANYIDKVDKRLQNNRQSLNDELRHYEQDCAYAATVRDGVRRVTLV